MDSFTQLPFTVSLGHFDERCDCFLTVGPTIGMINLQFNADHRFIDKIKYTPNIPNREGIIEYLSRYTEGPVNICSEAFILNTGMFYYKSHEENIKKQIYKNYTQRDLNLYIKTEYKRILGQLPNFHESNINKYDNNNGQPESFYFYLNRPSAQHSRVYKIHISIKPQFTNELFDTFFKFQNENSVVFKNLFSHCKIQIPSPIHLYRESEEWESWGGFIKDFAGGTGYFVLYPPESCTKDKFKENILIFSDWWKINFELRYPGAKRDNHYILYNERISETLYIAQGADTSSRHNAREYVNRQGNVGSNYPHYKFIESEKINNYIDYYCDYEERGKDNSQMGKCLKDTYGLDINCAERDCLPDPNNILQCETKWPIDKVWNIESKKEPYSSFWDINADSELGLTQCYMESEEDDFAFLSEDEEAEARIRMLDAALPAYIEHDEQEPDCFNNSNCPPNQFCSRFQVGEGEERRQKGVCIKKSTAAERARGRDFDFAFLRDED